MKSILVILILVNSLFSSPPEIFERDIYKKGEEVFNNKCNSCHVKSMNIQLLMKNFIEEDNKLLNLKAPTGNEISFRLKSQVGSKDDIEFQIEETADFVEGFNGINKFYFKDEF